MTYRQSRGQPAWLLPVMVGSGCLLAALVAGLLLSGSDKDEVAVAPQGEATQPAAGEHPAAGAAHGGNHDPERRPPPPPPPVSARPEGPKSKLDDFLVETTPKLKQPPMPDPQPGPEPPGPSETGGSPEATARLPSEADRQAARELLDEVYGERLRAAQEPAQQQAIAKELLTLARQAGNEPAQRFVLLKMATDLATQAGDPETVISATEWYATSFGLDPWQHYEPALMKLKLPADQPAAQAALAREAIKLVDGGIAADRYDAAASLLKVARQAAALAQSGALIKQVAQLDQSIADGKQQFAGVEAALAVLKTNPGDAQAHRVMGEYHCFLKGNWEQGLEHLSLSDDAKLAEAALKDMLAPKDGESRLDLADAWLALSESREGIAQRALIRRASEWYELALPQLKGLSELKARQRLAALRPAPVPMPDPTKPFNPLENPLDRPTAKPPESPAPPQITLAKSRGRRGEPAIDVVWVRERAPVLYRAKRDLPPAEYTKLTAQYQRDGFRPTCVSGYYAGTNRPLVAAIWIKDATPTISLAMADENAYRKQLSTLPDGFRPLSIDVYGSDQSQRFAAVWINDGTTPDRLTRTNYEPDRFLKEHDSMVSQGYHPRIVTAYPGAGRKTWYLGHWIREPGQFQCKLGRNLQEFTSDLKDFEAAWRPVWVNAYIFDGKIRRYNAVWQPDDGSIPWQISVAIPLSQFEKDLEAHTAHGYRPLMWDVE